MRNLVLYMCLGSLVMNAFFIVRKLSRINRTLDAIYQKLDKR